jgi:hypothetical protein
MSNRVAYNPYEAHKATDIPEAVIRHYIKTGELPAVRKGEAWSYAEKLWTHG